MLCRTRRCATRHYSCQTLMTYIFCACHQSAHDVFSNNNTPTPLLLNDTTKQHLQRLPETVELR
eukprot:m.358458 g.358458  ORF g.358458 m.358458 type:complete len:64 (-) comp18151_c0_seq1:1199-1390(-)